jgi:hypothetical protein
LTGVPSWKQKISAIPVVNAIKILLFVHFMKYTTIRMLLLNNTPFSNVTPSRLAEISRLFEVTWSLHYISLKIEVSGFSETLIIFTRPHNVAFPKIVISIVTSIKTSNLTPYLHKMALINICAIVLNALLTRYHGKPRHIHEDNIKMSLRRLYYYVFNWFENERLVMKFIEIFPAGCCNAFDIWQC